MLPLSGGACTVEVEGRRFELAGPRERLRTHHRLGVRPDRRRAAHLLDRRLRARARLGARSDGASTPPTSRPATSRSSCAARASRRRQLANFMVPEVFDGADKLICCEVLTPDGNWSSYPPHKHDATPECEVDNEEIYYFRVGRIGGVAYSRRRLRRAPHLHRRSLDRRDRDRARRRRVPRAGGLPRPVRRGARLPALLPQRDGVRRRPAQARLHRRPASALDPRHLGRHGTRPAPADDVCRGHRGGTRDEDRPADDGAGDRALPVRPAHHRGRRGAAAGRRACSASSATAT